MNRFLVSALALFFAAQSYSQTQGESLSVGLTPDSKYLDQIEEIYGQERMASDEELVKQLTILLKERITFQYVDALPERKYTLISTMGLHNGNNPSVQAADAASFNPETFNPLVYNWNYFDTKYQVFRIDGTNYLMIVAPQKINQQ